MQTTRIEAFERTERMLTHDHYLTSAGFRWMLVVGVLIALWLGWFFTGRIPIYIFADAQVEAGAVQAIFPYTDGIEVGQIGRIECAGSSFAAEIVDVTTLPDQAIRVTLLIPAGTDLDANARAAIAVEQLSPAVLLLRVIVARGSI